MIAGSEVTAMIDNLRPLTQEQRQGARRNACDAVEIRHANERAFQVALEDWQAATSTPDEYPIWIQFYANALQDALRKTNALRKETLSQMTIDDWRLAVHREVRADMWYQDAEPESGAVLSFSPAVEAIPASSNGNGTRPKVSAAAV
jgi:hypothetical protein